MDFLKNIIEIKKYLSKINIISGVIILIGLLVLGGSIVENLLRQNKTNKLESEIVILQSAIKEKDTNLTDVKMKNTELVANNNKLSSEVKELKEKAEYFKKAKLANDNIDSIIEERIRDFNDNNAEIGVKVKDSVIYVLETYIEHRTTYSKNIDNDTDAILSDAIIDKICAGDSTAKAAAKSIISSLQNDESVGELTNSAINSALTELPVDIRDRFVEKLFGNTVGKAFTAIEELSANGVQTQNLLNQLSTQSDQYIEDISNVLVINELDENALYKCAKKSEELYNLLYDIESETGVDVSIDIWKFCYWDISAFYDQYVNNLAKIQVYEKILEDKKE